MITLSLSQDSDVPLRQQISEQIVFQITTGELRAGEEMPSVRALARRTGVHHNTVSKAYQELVRREWLTRKHGARLLVGSPTPGGKLQDAGLDELINETIQQAKTMGYSLQMLRSRVRERLLDEPPDHLLVVEHEAGLRKIIQRELEESLHWRVECCSYTEILREHGLAIGAQIVAPRYMAKQLGLIVPAHRPCFLIDYSNATDQQAAIRGFRAPSIIAVASVSESMLKAARSVLAPSIGRKHTYQEVLVSVDRHLDIKAADLVFCDSMAFPMVTCNRKVHYQLLSAACLRELSMLLSTEI